MEIAYAQALWKSVQNGKTPKEAVAALMEILKRQGRIELMPRIQRAFTRLVDQNRSTRSRVFVAHEKDAKEAFAASGVDEADVCIDETLIGGWRLESADTLVDNSFKKHLLSIYSSVTNV